MASCGRASRRVDPRRRGGTGPATSSARRSCQDRHQQVPLGDDLIELAPTSNVFRKGHRLRVDVQPVAAGYFDSARTGGVGALQVHRGGIVASRLLLPVIPSRCQNGQPAAEGIDVPSCGRNASFRRLIAAGQAARLGRDQRCCRSRPSADRRGGRFGAARGRQCGGRRGGGGADVVRGGVAAHRPGSRRVHARPHGQPGKHLLDFFVAAPGRGLDSLEPAELLPIDVKFARNAIQRFNVGPSSCGAYGTTLGVAKARPSASGRCT